MKFFNRSQTLLNNEYSPVSSETQLEGAQVLMKPKQTRKKPTRKELLEELESIRASLIEIDELSEPLDPNNTKTITPEEDTESTMPLNPSDENAKALPGQQSLFDSIDSIDSADCIEQETPAATAAGDETVATDLLTAVPAKPKSQAEEVENPFLPKHVKERLAQEKQFYQRDLESVTKLSFAMKNSMSTAQCEAIVDALVAQYLPKIEEDLRTELLKMLEKEQEPS